MCHETSSNFKQWELTSNWVKHKNQWRIQGRGPHPPYLRVSMTVPPPPPFPLSPDLDPALKITAESFTTVFVDTRLSKTKHPRKRFQNFRQSCMLSTDRIEIHHHSPLAWRKEGQKVTLVVVIGGFRSDLLITCMIDGNFGNVSSGVLFSKGAYQRKRWWTKV